MNKILSYAFVAVASLALVLDIVALATAGWAERFESGFGLFKVCARGICLSVEPSTAGKVAAAFLILTVFLLTGSIVLAALGLYGKVDLGIWILKSWIICVVAAVFVLIAVATYGGMLNDSGAARFGLKFGYSYGLACAVAVLCIISAVLGFKMI